MIDRCNRPRPARRRLRWLAVAAVLLALVRAERTTGAEEDDAVVQPRDVAAEPRKPPGARLPLKAAGCKPENFKIALDVGHTPEAPGATSARGAKEFAFNLQLARRIQKALVGGGFLRTKLITAHGIGRDQLIKRTEQANGFGADLLLSIHHDDVQDAYHQKWSHNGAPHLYSDRFTGYSLFVSRDNRHFDDSVAFAKLLGTELTALGISYSAHHAEPIPGEGRQIIDVTAGVYRYDELFVLKFSVAPAVLLEAGIIVNRVEELVLASPQHQDQIAASTLAALSAFCSARQRG